MCVPAYIASSDFWGRSSGRQSSTLSGLFSIILGFFFDQVSLCNWLSWNSFVDEADLELTEIHPPLPPECWD